MAKCKNCKHLKRYHEISKGKEEEYDWCVAYNDNPDIERERDCEIFECMTNADRIRSMTDEELAEFLCDYDECLLCEYRNGGCSSKNCDTRNSTEKWLKSEVGCE